MGNERRSSKQRPVSRDREVEQQRRDRERRDRDRRRTESEATPKRQPKSKRQGPPRRVDAVPVATRERHEGLVGFVARTVVSLPSMILRLPALLVGTLRGVAVEVVGIFAGLGRATFGRLPGVSRLVRSSVPRPRRTKPATQVARASSSTTTRTPAQVRAAAEARARLQKRVRIALATGLLASVIAAWVFVPASNAFRIRHVEITGASSVDDLEIRTRIDKLLAGKTIYTVDEDAVAARIEELPFVHEAHVERHAPGGLQIHVTEYRPLALGYGDGDFWLVAHDGRILAKATKDAWTGRIPTVTLRGENLRPGVRVDDEPALQLLANRRADSTLAFDTIRATKYELNATLVDGTELRFGRPDQLALKVAAAERAIELAARHDERLLYVDVSVPARPARCLKTDSACFLPRGPQTDAERRDGESTATTPEETGGDEADVSDVLA